MRDGDFAAGLVGAILFGALAVMAVVLEKAGRHLWRWLSKARDRPPGVQTAQSKEQQGGA
jgi:hypothetical protein